LCAPVYAEDPAEGDGSRYNQERLYHSEISAADAYNEMRRNKSVLIDVRRLREFAAGHPERAYNVPYPHIVQGDQDPAVFYWEVYDIVKGRTDTPITTLCRTGARSVLAANILADPEGEGVVGGIPFTNVRNIWEGFVGQPKYAYSGGDVAEPHVKLDLNNDGVISDDSADVYDHTTDANPDKDGWRNFQQLPWSTKIRKKQAYLQDFKQYKCWRTDEGCIE
jgi:rhodanese-related sulfurtransferase